MSMRTPLSAALLLLSLCSIAAGQTAPESPANPPPGNEPVSRSDPHGEELNEQIEQWIRQLGDEKFQAREAASRDLAAIGHRARAALEAATKSADAEISFRAKAILERLPKITHTIVDALGQPIARAKVLIQFSKRPRPTGEMPVGDSLPPPIAATSEEDGGIAVPPLESVPSGAPRAEGGPKDAPQLTAGDIRIAVIVQHDNYGAARIELDAAQGKNVLSFPLVRRDTEARQRAVSGQLVAADGKPVVGAVIHGSEVRTPGEGLIEGAFPRGEALSDAEGRFTYYLPASATRKEERGALIPPNSRYHLRITVPDDELFFPWSDQYSNAEPHRIELPRATRFHRFRFEEVGGGWMQDPQQLLQQVRVQYHREPPGARLPIDLGPSVARTGRTLLPGKYLAERFANGKRIAYLPLVVAEDSPEELIFCLPPAVTYRGRIVEGATGQPLAGAYVIAWNSTSRNNLALLTGEDWKLLADAPSHPAADHPAMKRLCEFYGVQDLVRSDEAGQFEIVRQPDQEFYGLLAFAENTVPFKVSVGTLKPHAEHQVDAGEFPLFPAAKVLVRPVFDGNRLSVSPRWLPAADGQPKWFDRLQAALRTSSNRECEYVHWLTLNELQPVFVPANVKLQIRFETPYDDQWGAAPVAALRLEPGTSQDVGDLHFPENLRVSVQVLDEQGQPVEGVPVRQMLLDHDSWSTAHNTDGDGMAHFHAPPNEAGKFWASGPPGPRETQFAANLVLSYQVGEKSPPRPFSMTITAAQIKMLRGAATPSRRP